mmetsp:Transcript_25697/g.59949  ORF Transcript_25697/g.59949 Transcript_25697/m.59949 type:complete len:245 (+) Transcript_25697:2066-2800(+)
MSAPTSAMGRTKRRSGASVAPARRRWLTASPSRVGRYRRSAVLSSSSEYAGTESAQREMVRPATNLSTRHSGSSPRSRCLDGLRSPSAVSSPVSASKAAAASAVASPPCSSVGARSISRWGGAGQEAEGEEEARLSEPVARDPSELSVPTDICRCSRTCRRAFSASNAASSSSSAIPFETAARFSAPPSSGVVSDAESASPCVAVNFVRARQAFTPPPLPLRGLLLPSTSEGRRQLALPLDGLA